MTHQNLRIEPLSSEHDRVTFSCGVDALDRYLREQVGQDVRRHLSTAFVLFDAANGATAGYYTLAACEIDPGSLPQAIAKRLPRRPVPAILIGKLAVDLRYQRQRLGEALLANALIRAVGASREIGALAAVVDAKDDRARSFYERFGFQRFTDDPYRLFLPMSDAERRTRGR